MSYIIVCKEEAGGRAMRPSVLSHHTYDAALRELKMWQTTGKDVMTICEDNRGGTDSRCWANVHFSIVDENDFYTHGRKPNGE